MSNFKTNTEQPKKHIKEISADYYPFWQTYFDNEGINNPKFGAKLCYMGKEFSEERVECVRFWPSELSSGKDFYVELFNWDQDHYDPKSRKLYKLVNNPNWKLNTNKYVQVENSTDASTYAVKLSDLELVNSTPVTAAFAEVNNSAGLMEIGSDEPSFDDMFSEKEDCHQSAMTMRDHYCITHNVPFSNKQWLNELIKNAIAWQQKNQK